MCVFTLMCVYIHVYVCAHNDMHVHVHVRNIWHDVYLCVFTHVFTLMCVYIHVYVHTMTCMCMYMYVIYGMMYTYDCVFTHVCMCMYVRTYVYVCVMYVYIALVIITSIAFLQILFQSDDTLLCLFARH